MIHEHEGDEICTGMRGMRERNCCSGGRGGCNWTRGYLDQGSGTKLEGRVGGGARGSYPSSLHVFGDVGGDGGDGSDRDDSDGGEGARQRSVAYSKVPYSSSSSLLHARPPDP
eukprot:750695-Hanusia_phi.AAC.1